MISAIGILLIAFAIIVVNALVGRWVASAFVDGKSAPVAGFAFAIGVSTTAASRIETGGLWQLGGSLGVIAGLVFVWWLFFKRVKANG